MGSVAEIILRDGIVVDEVPATHVIHQPVGVVVDSVARRLSPIDEDAPRDVGVIQIQAGIDYRDDHTLTRSDFAFVEYAVPVRIQEAPGLEDVQIAHAIQVGESVSEAVLRPGRAVATHVGIIWNGAYVRQGFGLNPMNEVRLNVSHQIVGSQLAHYDVQFFRRLESRNFDEKEIFEIRCVDWQWG